MDGLAIYSIWKVHKLVRLYQKTGNELYKVLAEYYLRMTESPRLSKWFRTEVLGEKMELKKLEVTYKVVHTTK